MKVAWVNRTFGNYRIPVYAELDRLLGGGLHVLYSAPRARPQAVERLHALLGNRAIPLRDERVLLHRGSATSGYANRHLEVMFEPSLLPALARCKPDVMIGEGLAAWTAAALVHRITTGTRLVVSYQRTRHTERNVQWFRTAYRRAALRFIDVVCCNGRLSAEYTHWLGMPRHRIIEGASAAETQDLARQCAAIPTAERAEWRQRLRVNGMAFFFLGRLIELKGVDRLLEAWRLVQQAGDSPPATLLLGGDGPLRGDLRARCERYRLRNVRFLGAIEYEDIAHHYAAADVFLIPTLEDNWSLVVPEAMACGLPVLSSRFNGCWPELVHAGVNGFTFDPNNPEELAARIRYFLFDPTTVGPMGEASKRIAAQFSPHRAAGAFLRACELAMARHMEADN